jgi:hypothetical protein
VNCKRKPPPICQHFGPPTGVAACSLWLGRVPFHSCVGLSKAVRRCLCCLCFACRLSPLFCCALPFLCEAGSLPTAQETNDKSVSAAPEESCGADPRIHTTQRAANNPSNARGRREQELGSKGHASSGGCLMGGNEGRMAARERRPLRSSSHTARMTHRSQHRTQGRTQRETARSRSTGMPVGGGGQARVLQPPKRRQSCRSERCPSAQGLCPGVPFSSSVCPPAVLRPQVSSLGRSSRGEKGTGDGGSFRLDSESPERHPTEEHSARRKRDTEDTQSNGHTDRHRVTGENNTETRRKGTSSRERKHR